MRRLYAKEYVGILGINKSDLRTSVSNNPHASPSIPTPSSADRRLLRGHFFSDEISGFAAYVDGSNPLYFLQQTDPNASFKSGYSKLGNPYICLLRLGIPRKTNV
jgi:hypothetical protein